MSRIINKLIRKISGSELAQKQNASIIKNGKPNEEIIPFLRQTAADGCVLLKNNGALPINGKDNVALFGRVQNDSFLSATARAETYARLIESALPTA